jgi:hypothetical protein
MCWDGICNCGETSATCPGDCEIVLPLLRVEIHPDSWFTEDMYVDWYDPVGTLCEKWDGPKTCDWGIYGTASISGDDYGNEDPNWIEISGSHATSGYYRAWITAPWCEDMWDCELDEARIYVGGTLVRTMTTNYDLWTGKGLCMPVDATGWLVNSFTWKSSSGCP